MNPTLPLSALVQALVEARIIKAEHAIHMQKIFVGKATVGQVQKMSDEDWRRLDLPPGLKVQIRAKAGQPPPPPMDELGMADDYEELLAGVEPEFGMSTMAVNNMLDALDGGGPPSGSRGFDEFGRLGGHGAVDVSEGWQEMSEADPLNEFGVPSVDDLEPYQEPEPAPLPTRAAVKPVATRGPGAKALPPPVAAREPSSDLLDMMAEFGIGDDDLPPTPAKPVATRAPVRLPAPPASTKPSAQRLPANPGSAASSGIPARVAAPGGANTPSRSATSTQQLAGSPAPTPAAAVAPRAVPLTAQLSTRPSPAPGPPSPSPAGGPPKPSAFKTTPAARPQAATDANIPSKTHPPASVSQHTRAASGMGNNSVASPAKPQPYMARSSTERPKQAARDPPRASPLPGSAPTSSRSTIEGDTTSDDPGPSISGKVKDRFNNPAMLAQLGRSLGGFPGGGPPGVAPPIGLPGMAGPGAMPMRGSGTTENPNKPAAQPLVNPAKGRAAKPGRRPPTAPLGQSVGAKQETSILSIDPSLQSANAAPFQAIAAEEVSTTSLTEVLDQKGGGPLKSTRPGVSRPGRGRAAPTRPLAATAPAGVSSPTASPNSPPPSAQRGRGAPTAAAAPGRASPFAPTPSPSGGRGAAASPSRGVSPSVIRGRSGPAPTNPASQPPPRAAPTSPRRGGPQPPLRGTPPQRGGPPGRGPGVPQPSSKPKIDEFDQAMADLNAQGFTFDD